MIWKSKVRQNRIPALTRQCAYLRQNIQPDIDIDSLESFRYGVINSLLVTVGEPESQQSQRILQPISTRQGDRAEES